MQVLQGWKHIETYLGLSRKAILAQGYPIRQTKTGQIRAIKQELDEHIKILSPHHGSSIKK